MLGAILILTLGLFLIMKHIENFKHLISKMSIIASIALFTCLYIAWKNPTDKSLAKVRQVQGMYIFADCTPAGEYEVIGTVKGLGFMSFRSVQYESIRDKMIQRAKAEYPMGEGIILDLRDGGTDRADVIKFK